ncbi:unnamed protein product [Lupinus luteus]|uniref:Uncharacterized protein n=1 Tax=Lupinus luteus TaxID=3873 RepID=A0AAV1YMP6_LUPLU
MSMFNVGLNQLFDVEIDKINKPYLPLASGELSFRNGVIIVSSSLILGFLFAWAIGSWPLFWTNLISAVLAVAYSADVPFLRWKKYPVLTSLNFIIDGALARPIGYFLHMQTCVLKRPATFPRQLIFCIAIKSVLSVAIALLKDIPDVEGDEKFGIRSLSSRLGRKKGVAHAILASALWFRAKSVDVNDSASLQSFYTDFFWKMSSMLFILLY